VSARRKVFFFYWLVIFLVRTFLRLRCGYRTFGSTNVPATGGCILAANHASYIDPPAVGAGVRHRVLSPLARDTLFSNPVSNWIMRHLNCIPLDRTKGDIGALRTALRVLSEGGAVILFPEGTRSPDGELRPAKPGVGFLISKAGVPVIPVYVDGSFQALPKGEKRVKRHPIRVFYGTPIAPSELQTSSGDRQAYEANGALVMDRIRALREGAERG
jgi:1-acyl-sn-glycerol-3-phosphate acyltransferase